MIRNRLKRLESLAAAANLGRCTACAGSPRSVLLDSQAARDRFERQMREREQRCTCGRAFHVKIITATGRAVAA
jgi:hypothetical protein